MQTLAAALSSSICSGVRNVVFNRLDAKNKMVFVLYSKSPLMETEVEQEVGCVLLVQMSR